MMIFPFSVKASILMDAPTPIQMKCGSAVVTLGFKDHLLWSHANHGQDGVA